MATKVTSVTDGPRLTVSTMVKQPTLIPKRIISEAQQEYIVDFLLRKLPPTKSGVYMYDESTPLFADGDAAIVNEFGEIPVISGRVGERKAAMTVKRALAFMVSQEMVNRNDIDKVNTQIKQIRNTMRRTWETAFFNALLAHPDIDSVPVTNPWSDPAATIRHDIQEGRAEIRDAAPADDADNYFDFEADTLVIGRTTETDLVTSDDFNKVFKYGEKIGESAEYTGTIPGNFVGLKIMVSREMDRLAPNRALLLQARVIGGIGDERALSATPLYEDKPRESWRSDVVRQSAIVIDQPKAAVWLTGVNS